MLHEFIQWLMLPISGIDVHNIAPEVSWHGRIMVLAWGVAVPAAVLVARYFKVTSRQDWPRELDNKFWWHTHRALNYLAACASVVAALLLWNRDGYEGVARTTHAWMGWCVVVFCLFQVLGGHLRGTKGGPTAPRCGVDGRVLDLHGDHYDMTRRRIVFERVHKGMGYSVLLLAVCTLLLGLWTADAPRWMWATLGLWWLLLAFCALRLQLSAKCLDTYQAIWGPSESLPGAAIKPVGWGIHRVSLSEGIEKKERSA